MKRFFVMTLIGIMAFGISGNVYAGDETITEKISKGGTDEKALNELETWADEVVEQMRSDKENGFVSYELCKVSEEDSVEELSVFDEVEPNDTPRRADWVTVDDRCYGTISDEDDVDYYAINFDESGYLTITLKYIPEECDYDLFLFGSSDVGTDKIDSSQRGAELNEYIYTYVTKGVDYYVRVESFDGYSETEEYRLSFELDDTALETSYSVGTDYRMEGTSGGLDTTDDAENAMYRLGKMEYNNYWTRIPTYDLLNSGLPGKDKALESSVVTLHGHGLPGLMYFNYHGLVQDKNHYYNVAVRTNDDVEAENAPLLKYINLKDFNLEDIRMMLFSGCKTAADTGSKNLARYAWKRGVETTIGWEEEVNNDILTIWNEEFMYRLSKGYNVLDATSYADDEAVKIVYESSNVFKWKIYGNNSNVLRLNGPRTMQQNLNSLLDRDNFIIVDVQNNNFANLEEYIKVLNPLFNNDDFICSVRNVGEDLYKVRYNLYVNGFDMGYGYSAVIENNEVISLTQYGNMADSIIRDTEQIVVTDEEIEQAKIEAAAEIESNCKITEQSVNKMVRDDIHYLQITTKYIVDDGVIAYEVVKSYNYSID